MRNLTDKAKSDWKGSLAKVVHAYNCTRNEATGFALYYLLFGRNPRIPIDIIFGLPPGDQDPSPSEYAKKWRIRMDDAYRIASQAAQDERRRAKGYYDRKVYGGELEPGQRVLVRNGWPGKVKVLLGGSSSIHSS